MITEGTYRDIRNGLMMVRNDIQAEEEDGRINVLEADLQQHLIEAVIAMLDIRHLGWRYPDSEE